MQQTIYKNDVEYQQSDVLPLPVIDIHPTDLIQNYFLYKISHRK